MQASTDDSSGGAATSVSSSEREQEHVDQSMPSWMRAGYWQGRTDVTVARIRADEHAVHNEENLGMFRTT